MNKKKSKNWALTVSYGAVLCAGCVVLAYFAKSVFGSGPLRFTVESIPIFIAAFFFGPITAGTVALCSDLVSCLISGMVPIPLVSVGAVTLGVLSGVMYKYLLKKLPMIIRVSLSVFAGHISGSMLIKTFALYRFYGEGVLLRIPIYIGIAVLESIVLVFLMKNKAFTRQLEKAKDKK